MNKSFSTFLLICLILIIFNIIKNNMGIYNINEFYDNNKKETGLSDEQIKQVTGIAISSADERIATKLNAGKFIAGPVGQTGGRGPPGGSYEAMGGITHNKNINLALSRTVGTIPNKSVIYLDKKNARSYQTWYLTADGTIKNRFDNTCITSNSDIANIHNLSHMGDCKPNDYNRFIWDPDNRFVLKNSGGNKPLKCLEITKKPINNKNTTSKPRCGGKSNSECLMSGPTYYLKTTTCKSGEVHPNQVFAFG